MPGFDDGFPGIPGREGKPRNRGLTHVIDKGLNLRDIERLFDTEGDFVDSATLVRPSSSSGEVADAAAYSTWH